MKLKIVIFSQGLTKMNIMKWSRNTIFVFIPCFIPCLSYTSNRCDKVMSKIFRIIKIHTPDYRLNVAWRNEKLARFYSHRLKLSTPPFEK